MRKQELIQAFKAAFPHTLPVLTGFLVLGMAYGILMQTKGYGTGWSVLMSAVAFCGSMQFVAITLLTVAFDPLQAFLLSIMVNARHLFYGLSMLSKYQGTGKIRPFLIYTLCDETFSISYGVTPPDDVQPRYFYLGISLMNYLYWVFGTLLGGTIGSFLNIDTTGLDFVLTALFVVLFLEQFYKKENRSTAVMGLFASTICLFLFGSANMVIPSMILILLILLAARNRIWN